MGLDAYIYRKIKHDEPANVTSEEWAYAFAHADDHMKSLLTRMKAYGELWNYSLSQVLTTAMQEFLDRNESSDSDEIVYFRKFHFLNDYFNYTDENYAKDMIITKKQCQYLYDKAKACLDVCNKITTDFENKSYEICNKFFLSEYKDASYEKVQSLFRAMNEILNNTDWDVENIVYNADW